MPRLGADWTPNDPARTNETPEHWERRRRSFGRIAADYDRYRPPYPEAVYEDVRDYSALGPDAHILEVGAGTGIASRVVASWGYELTCLEPSVEMAALAETHLAPYPNARVEIARFEAWTPPRAFDLLYAAQAFHWIHPEDRYRRSAEVLRPGGTLATFWNVQIAGADGFEDRVQDAYRAHAPHLVHEGPFRTADTVRDKTDEIIASGLFRDVDVRRHPWSRTLPRDDYLGLVGTHSDHSTLESSVRERLHATIGDLVDQAFGGRVTMSYVCMLHLGRRA